MTRPSQNPPDYRGARRSFVAQCRKAHADSIGRVHPWAVAPDGKPLFIDSVALGPRQAKKALLVITGRTGQGGGVGSQVLCALLGGRLAPLQDRRLVMVHLLNPFGFAWGRQQNEEDLVLDEEGARHSWSYDMLRAICTEDLARCESLRVLEVVRGPPEKAMADGILARVLEETKPGLSLTVGQLALETADAKGLGRRRILAALASL